MEQKPKIVFFDMEGTLFRPCGQRADKSLSVSAWAALAQAMGTEVNAAEYENYKKWRRGEYSNYIPWMEDTSRIFKAAGLTKDFFDRVIHSLEYFPGVKETFDALHAQGIPTSVITGGFYEQTDRAQRDLGIHHAHASSRFFWDDAGRLSHWEFEEHGIEGKVDAAKGVAAEYGVSMKECGFVGDGSNDVHIACAVGTSIAFNGEPELRGVATHSVSQPKGEEDFRAVLDYLLPDEYGYSRGIAATREAGV